MGRRVADFSNVRFRDDIVRGVRIGALLLAAVVVALTAHRLTPEASAPGPREKPPAPMATPPAPRPAAVKPLVKHVSPVKDDVPPPPPLSPEIRRVKPPVAPLSEAPVAVATSEQIFAPEVKADDSAPLPQMEVAPAVVSAEQSEPAPAPEPAAPVKTQNRGKRWIKAVGHFLHLGGKNEDQR